MELIFAIIAGLIGSAIGSAFTALFLMLALSWVTKASGSFSHAYGTAFLASIVNVALTLFVDMLLETVGASIEVFLVGQLVAVVVGFLIQSGVIADRYELSFGRGCLVSLAMIGVTILVGGVLLLIALALATAAGIAAPFAV